MITNLKRAYRYIRYGIPTKKVIQCNVIESKSTLQLKGKHILITGGGSGIGYHIARKSVQEGAKVLITGRNEDNLKKTSEELNCQYIVFDVTDFAGYSVFMDKALQMMGDRIDCLVNNAGISLHEKNMMEVTLETFNRQLDTNLKAPYFLSQTFLRFCEKTANKNACIIFMTSERGLYCDEIPYGLIKAAIVSLTQGMARRWIKRGIRVNAIAPGITESGMTIADRNQDMTCDYNCGGRFFLPEEVAEVAVFLMSDASKCISGEVIACDQGNWLRCDW